MDLESFARTRTYDFLMGLPLILWFGNAVAQLRPALVADAAAVLADTGDLRAALQFLALLAAACFNLLLVYLLLVREKPVRKSRGLLPRLCGFLGTFLGVGIIHLPVAPLSLPWQALADILIFTGSTGSALALARLGKAFSIMPEARLLVTGGPYSRVRHPLYAAEMLTVAGVAMQFMQPWAALLGLCVAALQVTRSIFEERVLAEAWPAYRDYQKRTWRFIPGVI